VEKSSKRTVRGLENMVKTICCSLAVMIMLIGCAEKNLKAPSPADYPESSFFQAEGIGQSEREAGNEALAEMARIFESEVFSDTYDRASSYIDAAGDETYRARIESNIRVVSAVKLEGVRIIRTWFDNEKGNYHALAVLDRYKAKEDWQNGIEDNKGQSADAASYIYENCQVLGGKRGTGQQAPGDRVSGCNYQEV
jgi:hypothetical protein